MPREGKHDPAMPELAIKLVWHGQSTRDALKILTLSLEGLNVCIVKKGQ